MEDAHTKSVDEVLGYFGTDPDKGLSPDQVKRNQDKYGPNGKYNIYWKHVNKIYFTSIYAFRNLVNYSEQLFNPAMLVENQHDR